MNTYLITGGAGFIGSNFVLAERQRGGVRILNLDLLTYAANPAHLQSLDGDPDYVFIRGDIGDRARGCRHPAVPIVPAAVVNFAAESHVDRSITGPKDFIQTNVVGTFHLLEEVLRYWQQLPDDVREGFRFLHVSTDEVYGSLGPEDAPFHESHTVCPKQPLLGIQSRQRPFGEGLPSHLWLAHIDHQLFQQLRPKAVS